MTPTLQEKKKDLENYLSDLDNLIDTGWFPKDSVKECTYYHKGFTLRDFIGKGREYIRQYLVDENQENTEQEKQWIPINSLDEIPADVERFILTISYVNIQKEKRFVTKPYTHDNVFDYYQHRAWQVHAFMPITIIKPFEL